MSQSVETFLAKELLGSMSERWRGEGSRRLPQLSRSTAGGEENNNSRRAWRHTRQGKVGGLVAHAGRVRLAGWWHIHVQAAQLAVTPRAHSSPSSRRGEAGDLDRDRDRLGERAGLRERAGEPERAGERPRGEALRPRGEALRPRGLGERRRGGERLQRGRGTR